MSFRTRVLNIPQKSITLRPVAYTSFSDAFLNNPPDATISQDSCFIPVSENGGQEPLIQSIGISPERKWQSQDDQVGPDRDITGLNSGGADMIGIELSCPSYTLIAANTYDGLQRIYFPLYEANDRQGGFIEFCHDNAALVAWAAGSPDTIEFAQNGTLYNKGGIGDDSKIIVRWDGTPGPLGGGGAISDTNRIINI
jgi:hypothetical protein